MLLSRFGSVTSGGGATTAVLSRSPRAAPGTVPESVIVTLWPVASISPVHAPVPELYEPMLGEPNVAPISTGTVVSVSVNPRIVLGPLFVTVIRYETAAPATGAPLVRIFTTARSAVGTRIVVSVAVLLAKFGSVTPAGGSTVAVLESVPVASGSIVAVTTNVAVASAGRLTAVAMLPTPPAGPEPPPV